MRNWPNVLRALDAMESLKAMSLIVLIGWSDKCRVSVVVRAHEVEIIFESDHVDPVRRTESSNNLERFRELLYTLTPRRAVVDSPALAIVARCECGCAARLAWKGDILAARCPAIPFS